MNITDKLIKLRKELARTLFSMTELDNGLLQDDNGKLFKFTDQGKIEEVEEIVEEVKVEEDIEEVEEVSKEEVEEKPIVNEEFDLLTKEHEELKNEYSKCVDEYNKSIENYKKEIEDLKKEIDKLLSEPLQDPIEVEVKNNNKAVINKGNFKAAEYFH